MTYYGNNLLPVDPGTFENPFLNVFKTGGGWYTGLNGADTHEEALLYASFLDSSGYVISFTGGPAHTFTSVATRVMIGCSFYAGHWVFLYDGGDGTETFTFQDGVTVVNSALNRVVLNYDGSGSGIAVTQSSVGGTSYVNNFRLVYSPDSTASVIGQREKLLNSGEIFDPNFILLTSPFKSVRFMDWMVTNSSNQSLWANRPVQNWVFWNEGRTNNGQIGVQSGVPLEVMCALCNELNIMPWFNMPHAATDDYINQFALLSHSLLKKSISEVFVEYSNEVWNSDLGSQYAYAYTQGGNNFNHGSSAGLDGAFNFQGMRTAQMGSLWKTAWGTDASRITTVVGVQGGVPGNSPPFATDDDQLLTTPLWTGTGGGTGGPAPGGPAYPSIDAIAGAPYFGYNPPNSWLSSPDGGLSQTFTELLTGGLQPPISPAPNTSTGPTAFTVTSGLSLPDPPPDQTSFCVTVKGTATGTATLAVDGGTAYPLIEAASSGYINVGSGIIWTPSQGFYGGGILVVTYMASLSSWCAIYTPGYAGGGVKMETDVMATWHTYCNTNVTGKVYKYLCYESGQTFYGGDGNLFNLLSNLNNDPRMFGVYTKYFTAMATNGVYLGNNYNDIGIFGVFGFWPVLNNLIQGHSPRYDAIVQLSQPNRCGTNLKGKF